MRPHYFMMAPQHLTSTSAINFLRAWPQIMGTRGTQNDNKTIPKTIRLDSRKAVWKDQLHQQALALLALFAVLKGRVIEFPLHLLLL